MEYTVVNGASAIARGVTRYLSKGASKVKLLDYRVYRPGVYKLHKDLKDAGVEVEKGQTLNSKSLEYALEGSENIIYFTHDYVSMSFAKENLLLATSRAAKSVGAKNFIAV